MRTWSELEKLRVAVHPMASSLQVLASLSERAEADRSRMIAAIDNMSAQLTPLITQVATQGFVTNDHIRDCERATREREALDSERHSENQTALTKMDARTRRVERIYYFVAAAIIILGFLSSDLGRRVFHHFLPVPPS